ncbi:MAG: hypothetical protein IPM64_17175 [Phycisphaerales bacterium]|nr:hypothetical protein [Phycisphaerales bacterium]
MNEYIEPGTSFAFRKTIATGESDNDVGEDSRLIPDGALALAGQLGGSLAIRSMEIAIDGGADQRDTLSGTIKLYSGVYDASATPSTDCVLVKTWAFGPGTLLIVRSGAMDPLRAATKGHDLFLVVTFDEAPTDDVEIEAVGMWVTRN